MDKLPTKEQIKEKYNIPENNFEILTEFPTKEEIIEKKYGKLIKLGSIFGLKPWMLTTITGGLVAIIFILPKVQPTIDDTIEFWYPVVHYTYDVGKQIVQNILWPEAGEEIKTIAIVPQELEFRDATDEQDLEKFPIGTELYPVSGTMILG